MIDLQHMMNPLGPSPKAVQAIKNNLQNIHKYNGPLKELIQKIAEVNNVQEDQVMLSDGADGALTLIAQSVFKGRNIVIPQPCFHRYKSYSDYLGAAYKLLPAKKSLEVDEELILQTEGNILLLASPNNPTGFEVSVEFLKKALAKFEFVILDETLLLSFSGKQSLINGYPNLIIVRSFSKLCGLAGLRVGYILASNHNIQQIKKVSTPFKVNYLGQIAALAALEDQEHLEKSKRFIYEELTQLSKALKQESVELSKSLCYCISLTEKEALVLRKSILFSDKLDFGISQKNIFRFCIGTRDQNAQLRTVLEVGR